MNLGPDKCDKCDDELVTGFILDQTIGGNQSAQWLEESPSVSIWTF